MFERSVNYYETDRMGIVHHSNYIRYMEEIRTVWMEEKGYGYDRMEREGMMIPVTYVHFDYKKGLKFGDTFTAEARISEYNGVRMELTYTLKNKKTGEITGIGKSGHCFVDRTFRPVSLKKAFPEIHEFFLKILEEAIK